MPGKPVADVKFTVPIKLLVTGTVAKMKAFDLSDTKNYYRSIVHRAVNQAKNVGDIKQIDKHFEWIMIDDDFPSVFDTWHYTPSWHRPIGHVGGGPAHTSAAAPRRGRNRRLDQPRRRRHFLCRLDGEHHGSLCVVALARLVEPRGGQGRLHGPERRRPCNGRVLRSFGRIRWQWRRRWRVRLCRLRLCLCLRGRRTIAVTCR